MLRNSSTLDAPYSKPKTTLLGFLSIHWQGVCRIMNYLTVTYLFGLLISKFDYLAVFTPRTTKTTQ